MTNTSDVERFIKRLQSSRKKQGFGRDRLAELSGVSKSTIVNIENGKHLPYLHTAIALAKALNVSLDWLCGLDDKHDC